MDQQLLNEKGLNEEGVRTVPKSPTRIGLHGLRNRRTKISRLGTFTEVENHIFVHQDLQKFFVLRIYKVNAELNLSR